MPSPGPAFIVIPTYWTWPSTEGGRATTAAYDHPTPLDSASTLPALLEDLARSRPGCRVLILAGLTHPDLAEAVTKHARHLLEPFRQRLELRLCESISLQQLLEAFKATVQQRHLLHLNSYAGIRNLQLLVPHLFGAEAVIARDDDERLEPDYIERALDHLGSSIGDARVLGLAGPYKQPDGGVLLKEAAPTGNALRDKAQHINAAMRILAGEGKALRESPMALGGNMIFHRDLFTRVCFDPGITRGEDIDYLINARLDGIRWWFDPGLAIVHVPPRHLETPAYQRTREDVFRFVYEREKLRLNGQPNPDWLQPYPGALLGDDLDQQALSALRATATDDGVARLGSPQDVLDQARRHAQRAAPQLPGYLLVWRETMTRVDREAGLRSFASSGFPVL